MGSRQRSFRRPHRPRGDRAPSAVSSPSLVTWLGTPSSTAPVVTGVCPFSTTSGATSVTINGINFHRGHRGAVRRVASIVVHGGQRDAGHRAGTGSAGGDRGRDRDQSQWHQAPAPRTTSRITRGPRCRALHPRPAPGRGNVGDDHRDQLHGVSLRCTSARRRRPTSLWQVRRPSPPRHHPGRRALSTSRWSPPGEPASRAAWTITPIPARRGASTRAWCPELQPRDSRHHRGVAPQHQGDLLVLVIKNNTTSVMAASVSGGGVGTWTACPGALHRIRRSRPRDVDRHRDQHGSVDDHRHLLEQRGFGLRRVGGAGIPASGSSTVWGIDTGTGISNAVRNVGDLPCACARWYGELYFGYAQRWRTRDRWELLGFHLYPHLRR